MAGFTQLEIALLEKLLELKTEQELNQTTEETKSGYTCQECGRTLSKSSAKVIRNHEESKYHLDRLGTDINIDFSKMGRSKTDA